MHGARARVSAAQGLIMPSESAAVHALRRRVDACALRAHCVLCDAMLENFPSSKLSNKLSSKNETTNRCVLFLVVVSLSLSVLCYNNNNIVFAFSFDFDSNSILYIQHFL